MKYYTLDDIMELDPCHTRDKLETYMKGRKRISLPGILKSKASDDDKVWLVTRLLPADAAAEFARWCADSVSHLNNNWAAVAAAYADAADAADAAYAAARAAAYAAKAAYVYAYAYADAADAESAADAARKNQVNQLKLIVKEHNL